MLGAWDPERSALDAHSQMLTVIQNQAVHLHPMLGAWDHERSALDDALSQIIKTQLSTCALCLVPETQKEAHSMLTVTQIQALYLCPMPGVREPERSVSRQPLSM